MSASPHCGLLSLPPELRNRIYEIVVKIDVSPINICLWNAVKIDKQPAITRTCRQIRNESLPMYYQLNTFCFDASEWYLEAFRDVNGPFSALMDTYLVLMRTIRVNTCKYHDNCYFYELKLAKQGGFESLEMIVGENSADACWLLRNCGVNGTTLARARRLLDSCLQEVEPRAKLDKSTLESLIDVLRH